MSNNSEGKTMIEFAMEAYLATIHANNWDDTYFHLTDDEEKQFISLYDAGVAVGLQPVELPEWQRGSKFLIEASRGLKKIDDNVYLFQLPYFTSKQTA